MLVVLNRRDRPEAPVGSNNNTVLYYYGFQHPVSTKIKSFPVIAFPKVMKAKPETLENTMKSSPSLQVKPFTDKISSDGPPRRRAPPKSTKSLDGNEFRRQLGHNRLFSLDKIDAGSDERRAVCNTPVLATLNSVPPEASPHLDPSFGDSFMSSNPSKRAPPKRSKSMEESKFLPYTIPYLASKIDVDEPVNAFKRMTIVDTGPQAEFFEYSGDNSKTGSQTKQPQFRANQRIISVDKLEDGIDKGGTGTDSNSPTSTKVKGSPPAALSKFIKKQGKSSAITTMSSRSVQVESSTDKTPRDGTPRRRRAPPKSTKSLDRNEFRSQLGHNRVAAFDKIDIGSVKPNTPAMTKLEGSPPEASSKLMEVQVESPDNNITWSRSMQAESSAAKTSPDRPSRRRIPPKSTKSLDRNEFRCLLAHNRGGSTINIDGNDNLRAASNTPAPAKLKGCTPPEASPHLQLSFGDTFPGSKHHKRSMSMDENLFKSNFLQYPIPYLASKIDNDERASSFKALTMADTGPQPEHSESSCVNSGVAKGANDGLPGSQDTQPQSRMNKREICVDKINDSSDTGETATNAPASAKVKGFPPVALSKFIKKQRKASSITMTWSRSVKAEPSTGNTPVDGTRRERCAPPKSTKSLDGNEFRSQLGHNRVAAFDKIDVSNEKRSTAPDSPVSAKVKCSPPEASSKFTQAQPEAFDNTISWSRSLQLELSTENTSRDGSCRRRALPKSTKSLDGNECGSQLGHNQVLSRDTMGDGSEKRGTASITLRSRK